ncbi:MAG TPA: siderophore-interacting protein [Candidatus Limnocylindrales bacterium]
MSRLERLSLSFLRVTFTGDDLNLFADNGFDQRFKLVFPPRRTYTVRAVRTGASEVDVDMVLHENGHGPASEWLDAIKEGAELEFIGPDVRHDGPHGGVDFRPPAGARTVLLAGDETAVPAIASILERMPPSLGGEAILEVPCAEDFLPLRVPEGVRVSWYARQGMPHGHHLVPAVTAAIERMRPASRPGESIAEIDVDSEILWEVPDEPAPDNDVYVWLAGEAGVVRTLRRHLVTERGMDRRAVAFMGYWRLGRAEAG